MDTFTHGVLGACLAELLGNRESGKKILWIGAVAQNFPDIDVMAALWLDPAANVLAHRGITHSFLFVILSAPLLALIINRMWPALGSFRFWAFFLTSQFLIHDLIDGFNAYGTGWLEPFIHTRYAFHALFVADPLFSIPLLVGTLILIFQRTTARRKYRETSIALTISLGYLVVCLFLRDSIHHQAEADLQKQNLTYQEVIVTPTPFNSMLWFIATRGEAGSYVGYRSVWDRETEIQYQFFPRNDSLLTGSTRHAEIENLKRFSQGFYTVEQQGDTLLFNDLRFGQMLGWQNPRAGFVFHYYLQPDLDNTVVLQRGRFAGWDGEATRQFFNRILGQ